MSRRAVATIVAGVVPCIGWAMGAVPAERAFELMWLAAEAYVASVVGVQAVAVYRGRRDEREMPDA